VDGGVYTSYTIPPYYDPMIAKLIVWGRERNETIRRMQRALYEYVIVGIQTNIPFHKAVMANPRFVKGELETHFIERETTLLDDMKTILEQERPLDRKLSLVSGDKTRIAAMAAVAAVTQMALKAQSINA
jgi:pyruvate carboxylase subunit A